MAQDGVDNGRMNRPKTPRRPASELEQATPLLGGLSPQRFMARHWQRQPLWVKQAMPQVQPPIDRAGLFQLASQEGVESRLIERRDGQWRLRHGPMPRRALPPVSPPGWTLLVQGLDLQVQTAHDLLRRFHFIPQARLDDLMLSYASDGGGVGPHVDSYDVFLLQVQGRRHWRVSPPSDAGFIEGLPLRILDRFEPTQEGVLEPGDMLYLPPGWGHDGVAVGGDCMTASIGFRAPTAAELVQAVLWRVAEGLPTEGKPWGRRHADPGLPATAHSGALPTGLVDNAQAWVAQALAQPGVVARALGEWITEPKAQVVFDLASTDAHPVRNGQGVVLDRRTRMAHDDRHVFINGESYRMAGRDAQLLRALADRRQWSAAEVARLSPEAQSVLLDWLDQGWMHPFGAP